MKVLDFMNTHSNWEDILTQPPYCITVKRDEDYILLKYSQFNSDFSNEIVRECRGAIFYQESDGKYICVCRAFDKFGNYGEDYVADVDWNSAVVEEKIDGSLIKLWYHNYKWHLSTNGSIDAFKTPVGDTGETFGDLFNEALQNLEDDMLCWMPSSWYTYMFELVSPKSRVTILYPKTKLYYLGRRNMMTMKEEPKQEYDSYYGVLYPKEFNLHSLDDCLEYVKTMTKDEEGFVIRDGNFNRMKLKSPEYLFAFHCNNNGAVTTGRIIDMIKEEKIDDLLAYCPQYTEQVEEVKEKIEKFANSLDFAWKAVSVAQYLNRREFAIFIKDFAEKDYLFRKYDNRNLSAIGYIMSKPTSKIKKMIEME